MKTTFFVILVVLFSLFTTTTKAQLTQDGGIVFQNSKGINFFNFKNGREFLIKQCPQDTQFACSADGKKLVTFENGLLYQMDLPDGNPEPIQFPYGLFSNVGLGAMQAIGAYALQLSPDGKFLALSTHRLNLQTRKTHQSVSLLDIRNQRGLAVERMRFPMLSSNASTPWPVSANSLATKSFVVPLHYAFSKYEKWTQGEQFFAIMYQGLGKKGCPGVTLIDLNLEKLQKEQVNPGIYDIIFTEEPALCEGLTFGTDGSLYTRLDGCISSISKDEIYTLIEKSKLPTGKNIKKTRLTTNTLKIKSPQKSSKSVSGEQFSCIGQEQYVVVVNRNIIVFHNGGSAISLKGISTGTSFSYCAVPPLGPPVMVTAKPGTIVK